MRSILFDSSKGAMEAGLIVLRCAKEKQPAEQSLSTGESLRLKATNECVRWRSVFDMPMDDKND